MRRKLLVYLHVPFCNSKCHFCDWVQEIPAGDLRLPAGSTPRNAYINALIVQIRYMGRRLSELDYSPAILYWGGGTASILTCDEIKKLAESLMSSFEFRDLVESTIECSPESLNPEKLKVLREAGFSRISIGVQALNNEKLRRIGRAHSENDAINAVFWAREAGFDNINIDLICGFPDEKLAEFEFSLDKALKLPVNHISLYPYRAAHGTIMREGMRNQWFGEVLLEEQLAAYELGANKFRSCGLLEYAFSHFGQPACFSDMAYFQLEMDWIGLGSGCTSIINQRYTSTERGKLQRYIQQPTSWDENIPASSEAVVPRLMYQALTTWRGAIARLWQDRLGCFLNELCAQEGTSALLSFFRHNFDLVEDESGIRLPPQQIAKAFIELQFLNAPVARRKVRGIESIVGSY